MKKVGIIITGILVAFLALAQPVVHYFRKYI